MKAITITQPWATLLAIGAKHYETRSWNTTYRGSIAIHAAKGFPKSAWRFCFDEPCWDVLTSRLFTPEACREPSATVIAMNIPRGVIVAIGDLTDCLHTTGAGMVSRPGLVCGITKQEQAFGDFSPGRYAWKLENVRALPEPIPAKGALGLWEWDER